MTSRALVIGYGNPLRGDDGLGWYAARQLELRMSPDQAEIITCQQLTMDLAESISKARLVIFIDVSIEGEPGQVRCDPVEPESDSVVSFTHHMMPTRLLTCAQILYNAAPRAFLLSVCGASFGYAEMLSAPVLNAVPALLDRVCMLINQKSTARNR